MWSAPSTVTAQSTEVSKQLVRPPSAIEYRSLQRAASASAKLEVVLLHDDILKDAWWDQHRPSLFGVP